jgi:hypothetical protein
MRRLARKKYAVGGDGEDGDIRMPPSVSWGTWKMLGCGADGIETQMWSMWRNWAYE